MPNRPRPSRWQPLPRPAHGRRHGEGRAPFQRLDRPSAISAWRCGARTAAGAFRLALTDKAVMTSLTATAGFRRDAARGLLDSDGIDARLVRATGDDARRLLICPRGLEGDDCARPPAVSGSRGGGAVFHPLQQATPQSREKAGSPSGDATLPRRRGMASAPEWCRGRDCFFHSAHSSAPER